MDLYKTSFVKNVFRLSFKESIYLGFLWFRSFPHPEISQPLLGHSKRKEISCPATFNNFYLLPSPGFDRSSHVSAVRPSETSESSCSMKCLWIPTNYQGGRHEAKSASLTENLSCRFCKTKGFIGPFTGHWTPSLEGPRSSSCSLSGN